MVSILWLREERKINIFEHMLGDRQDLDTLSSPYAVGESKNQVIAKTVKTQGRRRLAEQLTASLGQGLEET